MKIELKSVRLFKYLSWACIVICTRYAGDNVDSLENFPIGLRGTFTTGGFRTGNSTFTLYNDFNKAAATASPALTASFFGTVELQFTATLIILP